MSNTPDRRPTPATDSLPIKHSAAANSYTHLLGLTHPISVRSALLRSRCPINQSSAENYSSSEHQLGGDASVVVTIQCRTFSWHARTRAPQLIVRLRHQRFVKLSYFDFGRPMLY